MGRLLWAARIDKRAMRRALACGGLTPDVQPCAGAPAVVLARTTAEAAQGKAPAGEAAFVIGFDAVGSLKTFTRALGDIAGMVGGSPPARRSGSPFDDRVGCLMPIPRSAWRAVRYFDGENWADVTLDQARELAALRDYEFEPGHRTPKASAGGQIFGLSIGAGGGAEGIELCAVSLDRKGGAAVWRSPLSCLRPDARPEGAE
jgi:hypothetical protein